MSGTVNRFYRGIADIIGLTANDFSGSHHRGEIAGSKSLSADTGIINVVIKVRPPDGGRSESITQSYSGAAWILS